MNRVHIILYILCVYLEQLLINFIVGHGHRVCSTEFEYDNVELFLLIFLRSNQASSYTSNQNSLTYLFNYYYWSTEFEAIVHFKEYNHFVPFKMKNENRVKLLYTSWCEKEKALYIQFEILFYAAIYMVMCIIITKKMNSIAIEARRQCIGWICLFFSFLFSKSGQKLWSIKKFATKEQLFCFHYIPIEVQTNSFTTRSGDEDDSGRDIGASGTAPFWVINQIINLLLTRGPLINIENSSPFVIIYFFV